MDRLLWWLLAVGIGGAMGTGCDDGGGTSEDDSAMQFGVEQVGQEDEETMGQADITGQPDLAPPTCTSQCDFVTQKQCSSEAGFRECLPEGACLAWGPEGACVEGENCVDGECQPGFGDLDCIAVSKCIGGCQQEETCEQSCVNQGSPQGQVDLDAFVVCTDTNCGALFEQEKLASGSQCTLENCEAEYLACIEVGTASCGETLECMQGCNEDGACLADCATQADFEALLKLTDILVCFENNCPDPETWKDCATSFCLLPSLACL